MIENKIELFKLIKKVNNSACFFYIYFILFIINYIQIKKILFRLTLYLYIIFVSNFEKNFFFMRLMILISSFFFIFIVKKN